jgi:hypothetical protein
MIFAQIVGTAIGGLIALAGVYVASRRAAITAEDADRRKEAADRRRWTRDHRLATYTDFLTRAEAVSHQSSVVGSMPEGMEGYWDARDVLSDLQSQTLPAYHRVTLLASEQVRIAVRVFHRAVDRMASLEGERLKADKVANEAARTVALDEYSQAYGGMMDAMRRELGLMAQRSPEIQPIEGVRKSTKPVGVDLVPDH